MDQADDSQHFDAEESSKEQSPSLLTIILDTNPAAWALLQEILPLSSAIANLLIFINAHLACNYTNQVAVVASHCDKAIWLYPTAADQKPPRKHSSRARRSRDGDEAGQEDTDGFTSKRAKLNGTSSATDLPRSSSTSNKYRPFRLIEETLIRNLTNLINSTAPETIQAKTSTMIAGALTLALSYINRATVEYTESISGARTNLADQSTTQASVNPDQGGGSNPVTNALQARILLVTLSPSTDLAHQYIPIMNSIFACQRLGIPIDVLQLPLPSSSATDTATVEATGKENSTVFLQQAADATHGIYIPAQLTSPSNSAASKTTSTSVQNLASQALLGYLLPHFLPTPSLRPHLILPTRIDVDFRAACFCHRNVISIGYVCSICLSIFCQESAEVLQNGVCLTCGSKLEVVSSGAGGFGKGPVVVARRKKKKRRPEGAETPTPA